MSADTWTTVVGIFADSCGITQWKHNTVNRPVGPGGREFISIDRHVESAIETAAAYSAVQPASISLRWKHHDEIGHVVLLDRRENRLQAVAVIPQPVEFFDDMPALYFSSGTPSHTRRGDDRLTIRELSLTTNPAVNGLPAVQFYEGLPGDAKGRRHAPWTTLTRADEVIRAAYGVEYAKCRFDDHDAPRRPRLTTGWPPSRWSSTSQRR